MAAILGMAAIGAWAVMTDRISYVITHGISMNPTYYQDDLVVLLRHDQYKVGQIVAYHDSAAGEDVLHRIIGGDATNGFVFKGDNNQKRDAVEPTSDDLVGSPILHVPKGGIWLKPLLSPTGLGMIGFLFVAGGTAGPATRRDIPRGRRKKRVKAMSRQGSPLATAMAVFKAVHRMPPLFRAATVLAAVVTLLALTLGVLGWMKPVLQQEPAGSDAGRSMAFSYSAAVPRSPAYDGTVVTSPDPIFRKLAHRVDLSIRYRGRPGIFDVTATMSDNNGWHRSMQLSPATPFARRSHDITIPLNLDALASQAKAAARAIGTSPGQVSIVLEAHVAGGPVPFTAYLDLLLDDLQLRLANGNGSLEVAEKAAARDVVPREISVLGRPIMTASQARANATLAVLAAAVCAAVIALATRRRLPLRTRSEIERRYPQLLVPVEAMASPPGKPVVAVDNFPALVKLAERYGQMILTWRRPDADDFVVRDEGITYRYRIPLDEPTLQNVDQIDRPPTAGSHRRTASSPLP